MSNAQCIAFLSFGLIIPAGGVSPSVYDVRAGVDNGSGQLGTLTSPVQGDVRKGVQYGGNGTQYTGTYALPAPSGNRVACPPILPTGFFGEILAENNALGLSSILPEVPIRSNLGVKARLLAGQINWTPCQARWKGCKISVSLSDAQFLLALEAGGDTQQGRLTVTIQKLEFGKFAKGYPKFEDTLEIQSGAVWHQFVIAEMIGQYDDNDPALTLFLEKDQNDIGD